MDIFTASVELSKKIRLSNFKAQSFEIIESTSTFVIDEAKKTGKFYPRLIAAEVLTKARGRQPERIWHNEKGSCLMFSLALLLNPKDWLGLSLVTGISIAETLKEKYKSDIFKLKWPNDLWFSDNRKLGGILIETLSIDKKHQNSKFATIGVAINLKLSQFRDKKDTATLDELNLILSDGDLLLNIIPKLIKDILNFEQLGFKVFIERFNKFDILKNQRIHFKEQEKIILGIAKGINKKGALIVKTEFGIKEIYGSEISVRPQNIDLPNY